MWWALLMGCGPTIELGEIEPGAAAGGEQVEFRATGVDSAVALLLRNESAEAPLESAYQAGPERVGGTVPGELPPGSYHLIAQRGSSEIVGGTLQVLALPSQTPCSDAVHTVSELSHAREEVVIQRTFRSGQEQEIRLPLDGITAVELQTRETEAGRCTAIVLRTGEGPQIFADDVDVDLSERAALIAQGLGVDLVE